MGHIHLIRLPKTTRWKHVAELLGSDAPTIDVASASAAAAEKDLARLAHDPTFVEATRLLCGIPVAASSGDFVGNLTRLGLDVSEAPALFELIAAVGSALDRNARRLQATSDLTEITKRAIAATLTHHIGDRLPGLFEATPEDVRTAAARLRHGKPFAGAAREFFASSLNELLGYYLSRALSAHIGPRARFPDIASRSEFNNDLARYSYETTRIIREFSAGWYGKTLRDHGHVDTERAATFAHVAFKKIREELAFKRTEDA